MKQLKVDVNDKEQERASTDKYLNILHLRYNEGLFISEKITPNRWCFIQYDF